MWLHLLVCESQEAVGAGVSCRRQRLRVSLHADGLQPHAHRPLRHTHLRHDGHAHLRTYPWLHHGGRRSEYAGRERDTVRQKHRKTTAGLCLLLGFTLRSWPFPSCPTQGPRVSDEFIQHVENLTEGRSLRSLSFPAVQHELVQHHRTVHGSRQTVAFIYRFDHLQHMDTVEGLKSRCRNLDGLRRKYSQNDQITEKKESNNLIRWHRVLSPSRHTICSPD